VPTYSNPATCIPYSATYSNIPFSATYPNPATCIPYLHVEYAERGKEYGILFIYSLFCEYIHPEHEGIRVIYRVNQAKYGIHILVVEPQEYANIYSTRRILYSANIPESSEVESAESEAAVPGGGCGA